MPKRAILFVDDEKMVLQGLKRMLFKYKKEWDMHFITTGEEALEYTKSNPVDIIISDMQMPKMSGVELLERVKARHPNIIRIILSGQSDEEQLQKAANIAHQFLSKPCSSETIKEVIDNAFFTFGIVHNEQVKRILSNIDSLPTLPIVYKQLVEEAQSPDFSIKKVGEIVSNDPSLSANILKLVNSSFWGLSRKVMTPEQATSLLGFDIIKGLVLSTDLFHQLTVDEAKNFSSSAFMNRSQKSSSLSKAIMKDIGGSKEQRDAAAIAGMLNDLGQLVLLSSFTQSYSKVIEVSRDENRPIQEVEKEVIGVTHADIGAYLLGIWGLEKQIVEAIAYHHIPDFSSGRDASPVLAVAAASAILNEQSGEDQTQIKTYLEECGLSDKFELWKQLI